MYPLETIPGLSPLFFKRFASQITKGVLPFPPTLKFPTTITFWSGFHASFFCLLFLIAVKKLNNQDKGNINFIHDLFSYQAFSIIPCGDLSSIFIGGRIILDSSGACKSLSEN